MSTTTVIDDIGLLVTNDPTLGEGPLGIVRDASLVFADGVVVAVGRAGATADERIDVGGRCVIPGFVDSHSHLVFAGDRGDEFAARMAGAPYRAGGIRVSVDATRAADDVALLNGARARLAEAHRAGITTIEIKSGYGLTVHDEARSLRLAAELTPHTTFLGAHVVPPEFEGRQDAYVDLVCGDMLDAAAPHARWIDAFCEV
ncbi:MAG: imidazolonepropionase, partial [Ilumatobacteraceae bacterium]